MCTDLPIFAAFVNPQGSPKVIQTTTDTWMTLRDFLAIKETIHGLDFVCAALLGKFRWEGMWLSVIGHFVDVEIPDVLELVNVIEQHSNALARKKVAIFRSEYIAV